MKASRQSAVLLVLLAVVTSTALAGGSTAQSRAIFLSVSADTVPAQPTAGESFDLDIDIHSADAGTNNAYISRISLVNSTETPRKRYGTNYSIGQVTPGNTLGHTMPVKFDEPGVYNLYLDLSVQSLGRTYHVYEPVTIRVYDSHPLVEGSAGEGSIGRQTGLNVTVANPEERPIRGVEVQVRSDSVTIESPRRVIANLAGSEQTTFRYLAKVNAPGEKTLEAQIRYTNASGERRHVTRQFNVSFAEPDLADDVNLAAEVAPTIPGSETQLNVTVANGLDKALRQIQLRLQGEGTTIAQPERVDGMMESGEDRTYTFRVSKPSSGPQQFTAELTYTTADGTTRTVNRTLQTVFDEPQNPGQVTATGIQIEREGDTLQISGTASNIGGSEVTGVVVGVGESDAVRASSGQSEYFVGTIPASDFVSFDTTAQLVKNTTSATVPLQVAYTVDGVRMEREFAVQWEQSGPATPPQGDGGLSMLQIGGILAFLIVVGLGVVYWRRR